MRASELSTVKFMTQAPTFSSIGFVNFIEITGVFTITSFGSVSVDKTSIAGVRIYLI